jgi:hypothetical protein
MLKARIVKIAETAVARKQHKNNTRSRVSYAVHADSVVMQQ